MKKLLSLTLAVIMLLSVMPMAFAAEESLKDVYVDEVIKIYTYGSNIYDNQKFKDYVLDTYFAAIMDDQEQGFELWYTTEEEEIPEKLEKLKEINAELEGRIANGEATVLVDTSVYITATYRYFFTYYFYGIDVEEMFSYYIKNNGIDYDAITEDYYKAEKIIVNNTAITQEEFDALTKETIAIYDIVVRHAFGEHEFVEYISNNDATEQADGTKTATCKICGATDTVVDEGSKLVKEPATFFERVIALIKEFFSKILSIFG